MTGMQNCTTPPTADHPSGSIGRTTVLTNPGGYGEWHIAGAFSYSGDVPQNSNDVAAQSGVSSGLNPQPSGLSLQPSAVQA